MSTDSKPIHAREEISGGGERVWALGGDLKAKARSTERLSILKRENFGVFDAKKLQLGGFFSL